MDKKAKSISRRKALTLTVGAGTAAVLTPHAAAQVTTMKTPGVYIVEKDAFPNSVVEVATSIPVFIGYTEKAAYEDKALSLVPMKIVSSAQYSKLFGDGPSQSYDLLGSAPPHGRVEKVSLGTDDDQRDYHLEQVATRYALYDALRLFYDNGDGPCWIISVGSFSDEIDADKLLAGVALVDQASDAAIMVIPDAARLAAEDASRVHIAMLESCGARGNRFAILDIVDGEKARDASETDPIDAFRDGLGSQHLSYGAAYYPWLETTLHQISDMKLETLTPGARMILSNAVREELQAGHDDDLSADDIAYVGAIADPQHDPRAPPMPHPAEERITPEDLKPEKLNARLREQSQSFRAIMTKAAKLANVQPPSGAMAGIFAKVDNDRGVWHAPANVGVASVNQPMVTLNNDAQSDLNTPLNGKAVNAIRTFQNLGTLVWGARTLDGNSLDWRYINVRRTVMMIEQSIEATAQAFVFEPNNASTWVTIKAMISNYLTDIWKQGGLAGATPSDAFSVQVGLGSTMTGQDVLDGKMRISVNVAVSRPAEFIVISFEQQMQQS